MVKSLTYGRLGNFMFQISTGIGYALKHGLVFTIPNKTNNAFWNPIYLQHLVNPNWDETKGQIVINENGHQYQELPFQEEWIDKNIVLNGYWQSEKYFKEYRNELLKLFGFHWELKKGLVSVHVRRGDYLNLTHKHPPVTKEWYEQAMNIFPNYRFKFFSDDIQWCKETFSNREDCEFSNNTNELNDLIEMSYSEHFINSASTFSWWGAWLSRNEDKKIVLPKLWFVPNWDACETKDIVPDTWIKL